MSVEELFRDHKSQRNGLVAAEHEDPASRSGSTGSC